MSRRLTLRREDDQKFVLGGMDEFLTGLLREIPGAGVPEGEARERFFPKPTAGTHPEADGEWAEFVQPELEEQFLERRDCVAEDLRGLKDAGRRGWELVIPRKHLGAWIHALNQARIALSCRNRLGERELDEDVNLLGPEGVLVFQVRFYGLLQEWMLSVTDEL
jgi:hypothetical protein